MTPPAYPEFAFSYIRRPIIPVLAVGPRDDIELRALIDTGADMTVLDASIARDSGFDLERFPVVRASGVGGGIVEGRLIAIRLIPLFEEALEVTIDAAFVPDLADTAGNLIGRDVLEYLDFALTHSTRVGYLGRTETLV